MIATPVSFALTCEAILLRMGYARGSASFAEPQPGACTGCAIGVIKSGSVLRASMKILRCQKPSTFFPAFMSVLPSLSETKETHPENWVESFIRRE